MASGRNRNNPPPPAAPGSARQNEYFVPRDGIDREVITADVCRYLGNDALVRPGTYEVSILFAPSTPLAAKAHHSFPALPTQPYPVDAGPVKHTHPSFFSHSIPTDE